MTFRRFSSLSVMFAVVSFATPRALAETAEQEPAKKAEQASQGEAEGPSEWTEGTEEGLGEEEEYKNGLLFGFSHMFHLHRDKDTPVGTALGDRENLYGVFFAFERILHPHVSLTLVKPFYFNRERLDSPFEILVNGLYRKNNWEPFLAAGILGSLRVFYAVRDENGVAEKEFSFGVRFVAGVKYFVTPHWCVSFEFGYTYVPADDIIEHEISDTYIGGYFF